MLYESNDLERARAAASQLNNDVPGVFISIGDNRRAAICCSTFTDNTLGFIKAFLQMVNYIAKANYELAEYYRNN